MKFRTLIVFGVIGCLTSSTAFAAGDAVDEAYARYSIEREDNTEFWVVGGSYTDTDFKQIRTGAEEERYGPYTSLEQAKAVWKEKAMSTVDDAYARYRIEEL